MRIGILEDEVLIADHLSSVIEDKGYEVCFVADNVEEAKELLKNNIDFLLLDIKVNGKLSGIDMADYVNQHYQIPFIFISSNTDDETIDKVKLAKPYGFLSKPFKNFDVDIAIDLALEKHSAIQQSNPSKQSVFFVKDKGAWIKLNYNDILYVEAADNYSTLFFTNQPEMVITKNLKYFESIFPESLFIRINRSIIVKIASIDKLDAKYVYITEKSFVISDSIKEELRQKISI
ncbi:MAG: response regulator transcription factor [Bacteroidetes bacterium]|nr:response regulator transcription factor [Bacteroidota bacterium]